VKTPKGIEPAAIVARMRDQYGILIGTGLDKMRTTTLRIGTMAMTASPHYVLPTCRRSSSPCATSVTSASPAPASPRSSCIRGRRMMIVAIAIERACRSRLAPASGHPDERRPQGTRYNMSPDLKAP
jgi:hypothetical protein